jgi:hypothetical protein
MPYAPVRPLLNPKRFAGSRLILILPMLMLMLTTLLMLMLMLVEWT